jgi:hypothetical protein
MDTQATIDEFLGLFFLTADYVVSEENRLSVVYVVMRFLVEDLNGLNIRFKKLNDLSSYCTIDST